MESKLKDTYYSNTSLTKVSEALSLSLLYFVLEIDIL